MHLIIRTDKKSPRLEYTMHVIFNIHLDLSYTIIQNWDTLEKDAIIINYATKSDSRASFNIYNCGLLTQRDILDTTPAVLIEDGLKALFKCDPANSPSFTFGFDLFSMIFYLLSRYEEYLPYHPDKFGRYASSLSVAARHDFLDSPLVDLWILNLKHRLENLIGSKIKLPRTFKNQPTIDIDIPFAFHGKGWKNLPGLLKDLGSFKLTRTSMRWKYLTTSQDPFDTYAYMHDIIARAGLSPIYFILVKYQKPWDENHAVGHPDFIRLCATLSEKYEIGLHPSIYSGKSVNRMQQEKEHLENLIHRPVLLSRQHFLCLNIARTYSQLEQLGITADYSMIYADQSGFRASTCIPFPWYDLSRERQTQLQIVPTCIMDATMRRYNHLDMDSALAHVNALKERVKKVDGEFHWIWHNSSFSEGHGWKGWSRVFEQLCE